MTISLQNLIQGLSRHAASGSLDVPITGIRHDSRAVQPGDLFLCLRGAAFDGHRFALDALHRGAVALVVEAGGLERIDVTIPAEIPVITVPDSRAALSKIACAFYGNPSHAMLMVAVTGTNGKTTTTHMVASILRAHGLRVGTIGTIGADLDGEPLPSEHTTPEANQLQQLLATMRDRGAQAVVMEASSHALAQGRTDGIAFNVGVFTNLTQDHLDFHHTMEAYMAAKERLFTDYPILYPRPDGTPFCSVINVNQWEGRDLVTQARGRIITYSTTEMPAVLKPHNVVLGPESITFDAIYDPGIKAESATIALPIGGEFQVGNALGAIGAGLALGVPLATIAKGLAHMPPVPGRFEPVSAQGLGFSVVVDYAHTPDGLANVLHSARKLNPTRLLCVFGCGGDRDRTKRPIMGRLAATLSEFAVVTSDNPRTEDPAAIIHEIMAGIDPADPEVSAEVVTEPDRRKAIELALRAAEPGSIMVIAGKGHETYQIVGTQPLPFDDRAVAAEILAVIATERSATGS
jgi:UDP-N-acetylmuramoyl-L-alanyl-D-glutamate--2,6-diaminopimelate ligase